MPSIVYKHAREPVLPFLYYKREKGLSLEGNFVTYYKMIVVEKKVLCE